MCVNLVVQSQHWPSNITSMPRPDVPRPKPLVIDDLRNDSGAASTEVMDDFFRERHFTDPINPDDTVYIADLGSGTSGRVTKVRHIPTNTILARKIIRVEVKAAERTRIMRELDVLKGCRSPYIVGYLSACHRSGEINLFMEYMDGNSLDEMMKKTSKIPEPILGKITVSVLKGLTYLRDSQHIMHRDIKPSNILVNSKGEIKICDFGVSVQLIDSMAQSFVGTRHYMAPERLYGQAYTVQSDIWSLGLTLVELALGEYPIPQADPKKMYEGECSPNKQMSVFDLMDYVIHYPSPTVPREYFSQDFRNLVDRCLEKSPMQRFDLRAIMQHPFVRKSEEAEVDVAAWVYKACTGLSSGSRSTTTVQLK